MNIEALIDALVVAAPELAPMLAEHLSDNDGLLPHVFFGCDVEPLAVVLHGGSEDDRARLAAMLALIETAWVADDEAATNVIAVSFLEGLAGDGVLAAMRPMLGPGLGKVSDRYYLPQPPPTLRQRGAMLLHRMFPGFPKGA